MPQIDAFIDELGPMTTFTALDARAAFSAVNVESAEQPEMAFSDGYQLFQFCCLSFGLSITFQRTMNLLLSSVLGKLCFLDDVVIYSRVFTQHMRDLQETLTLLTATRFR